MRVLAWSPAKVATCQAKKRSIPAVPSASAMSPTARVRWTRRVTEAAAKTTTTVPQDMASVTGVGR